MIVFYDKEGQALQRFDYSREEGEKEFTAAAFNPSGEYVVVGSFNRFRKLGRRSNRVHTERHGPWAGGLHGPWAGGRQ